MKKNSLQRNILFGFLSWLLPLALAFVSTPFVVHGLGVENYGLYALVLGFISYSFTFNVGRAVTKYVAEYQATNQHELIGEVLSATLILNLIVGVGGAGILILLTRFLTTTILQIEPHLQTEAVTGFYLAATTLAVIMLGQVFSAVLQAVGRFDAFSHTTTATSVLLVAGNLFLVWNGYGLNALLAWNLITTIVSTVIFYFIARRMLPDAKIGLVCRPEMLRMVAKFSAGIVGYQILGNILLLFERSWITRSLGTESLTYYAVPMALAIYIQAFVFSLSLVLMPLTSEVEANKQPERLLAIYTRATKYIGLIVVFLCVALSVGSAAFLNLWLGAEFAARSSVVLVFHILTFGAIALGVIAWQITDGLGFPARNAWLVSFWLILGVPLMMILTGRFSLEGAAAARAISVCASVPVFILFVERQTFGASLWAFWRKMILSLALAGAAGGLMQYVLLGNLPHSWLGFVAATAGSGLSFVLILLATRFFSDEEQRWLRQFAAKAFAAP